MTAINMHDEIFDPLRQFQFFQEQPGKLVFRYIPKQAALSAAERARIQAGLAGKLGGDVTLDLTPVGEIPRTRLGKYRFLDQRLKIQYGEDAWSE